MFRRHHSAARGEKAGGETSQPTRVELPRRVVDVPVAPSLHHHAGVGAAPTGRVAVGGDTGPVLVHAAQPGAPEPAPRAERRVVVGAGIELKGEVKGCKTLEVDGDLDATVAASEHLVLGAEGSFRGACEVETADIAGNFDGTLSVRGRLLVRATGVVRGDIRFGELEIERGGQLSGNVDVQTKGPQLATVAAGAAGD
ncbi:MAG: polymer-forming cytoskeletal protein [Alphaproteobacteria bacterium]